MTIFSFNSLNTFCFRFLNIFIMISLKSLLNSASGPSCSQFLLTLFCCFYYGSHFLVFVFDICRNFRQFNGHCGWYILEALDSVTFIQTVLIFVCVGLFLQTINPIVFKLQSLSLRHKLKIQSSDFSLCCAPEVCIWLSTNLCIHYTHNS